MIKPKILIFSGYGYNSENETKFGFEEAGANVDIVHINDLIDSLYKLDKYQVLSFPGGFSYGDDTGSGNAYANKLKNHLWDSLMNFITKDTLIIGICNGFQTLINLGLLPAFHKKYGVRQVALLHNDSARLITRWTDLKAAGMSPWLADIDTLSLPIAHGEGKFYADSATLQKLRNRNMIALRYVRGEMAHLKNYQPNPNGSMEDIAGITDETGRILGLMPHPERGMFFTQFPHWTLLKEEYRRKQIGLPKYGPGIKFFQNAVKYFN